MKFRKGRKLYRPLKNSIPSTDGVITQELGTHLVPAIFYAAHEKNGSGRKHFGSQTTRRSSHASSSQRYQSLQIGTSNRSQSQTPRGNSVQPNNNKKDWKPSKSPGPQKDRSTPRLSDKEKFELLASGSCFNCKKPGHLSCNCPREML